MTTSTLKDVASMMSRARLLDQQADQQWANVYRVATAVAGRPIETKAQVYDLMREKD